MKEIFDVKISKKAIKDLKKIPMSVAIKLQAWIDNIGHIGLNEVRKISGYHDEPLQGKRYGQRSIRLSKVYRAIYVIEKNNVSKLVEILEVNKHEY